jgi:hypothetical protein
MGLLVLVSISSATAVQLVRQRGIPAVDTIWAEDGAVFLAGALEEGGEGLLSPYSGYANVVARAGGEAAAAFPLDLSSEILAVVAAGVVALLCVYVFVAARLILPSPVARGVLAGMMPLLPAASWESLANVSTLHFFLLFAAFWAALPQERSSTRMWVDGTVLLAAALSTPLAATMVPMSVWGLVLRRDRRNLIVAAGFFVGLAVQAWVAFGELLLGGSSLIVDPISHVRAWRPLETPGLYGFDVVAPLLAGYRLIGHHWALPGWFVSAVGIAVAVLVAVYAASRKWADLRRWALILLAYSFGIFTLTLMLRGSGPFRPVGTHPFLGGNRYMVVPMLFLLAALLLLLFPRESRPSRGRLAVRSAFLLLMAAVVGTNLLISTVRSLGPRWSSSLSEAAERCRRQGLERTDINISPPGWSVKAACHRVA